MELRQIVQQRQADLEEMAVQMEDVLAHEREQIAHEREQITREREYLDQQRQEVVRQRVELERLHAEATANAKTAHPSTRDTWLDARPDDRLESARKRLRELAERRKASEQTVPSADFLKE